MVAMLLTLPGRGGVRLPQLDIMTLLEWRCLVGLEPVGYRQHPPLDCFEQRDIYIRRHLTMTSSFAHKYPSLGTRRRLAIRCLSVRPRRLCHAGPMVDE
jgi:hypothetical protein